MELFKEITGIIAVLAATAWMIYLITRPEGTITISEEFNVFMKGDVITIGGEEYTVVKVKGNQLTFNGPTLKGRIQSIFNRISNLF
ncbi:MAG TPA: hypothetical protein DDY18_11920 [Flavobacterium sp.]|jgi:hypothetical protein|nr:hypothetical protein [Flavobacterium sp.]